MDPVTVIKIALQVYRRRFEYEKIMAERRRGLHSKGNAFSYNFSYNLFVTVGGYLVDSCDYVQLVQDK